VKEKYHQEYAYGTVYDLVRQRWQAKLKVPRPRSIKQDLVAKEEFKKNYLNS
jgi:transposase